MRKQKICTLVSNPDGVVLTAGRDRRDAWLQFILCTALGLGIPCLAGQTGNATIAVSAILTLYTDRGPGGYRKYVRKRVAAQVVLGAVVVAVAWVISLILPTQSGAHVWLTAMTAIAICIPLQHRFSIAPLTVSAGNAVLIMTVGIGGGHTVLVYLQRVASCIVGCVIALGILWVFGRLRNPGRELYDQLMRDSQALLDHRITLDTTMPDIAEELYIAKKLEHVAHSKKDRKLEPALRALWQAQTGLAILVAEPVGLPVFSEYELWFDKLCMAHRRLLQGGGEGTAIAQAPLLPWQPVSPEAMRWLVCLHDYEQSLRKLAWLAVPLQYHYNKVALTGGLL